MAVWIDAQRPGLATGLVLGAAAPLAFALHPTALPPGGGHGDAQVRVEWGPLVPLGLVCAGVGAVAGAGGIGYQLFLAGSFYYNIHEVGLIVYLCLAVAVVLEVAATQLRKRYIVQH